MIKKLIEKIFAPKKAKAAATAGAPVRKDGATVYKQSEHGINRNDISAGALRVCEMLQQENFKAYVVGGAVRDLILGRHPKDFDVATNATPEEVRNVIRRARIIGRRFKLVHVMFGQETIEVSTFRANHPDAEDAGSEDNADADMPAVDEQEIASASRRRPDQRGGRNGNAANSDRNDNGGDFRHKKAHADEHGRLLRDNVYGNMGDDAVRRDFTMNALFYDPQDETVWDYVNGFADVKKRTVVMIGDPATRYREDPVRMLRAARLAGKLGFTIDPATQAPIAELKPLLQHVPSARIYDEALKMLLSGDAVKCLQKLQELQLQSSMFAIVDRAANNPKAMKLINLVLTRTDERIAQDKGVSPAFLFAALFWHEVMPRAEKLEAKGELPMVALHTAMDDVLDAQRKSLAVPRRLDASIKELWAAQPRFAWRSKGKAFRTLAHPRFRASYDFYELRAQVGDADIEIAHWWEKFQFASEDEQNQMLMADESPKPKKRRSRGRKNSGGPAVLSATAASAKIVSVENYAPRDDGRDEQFKPEQG
jgi:poly(A) polymerase